VQNYENALIAGDFATAWAMLGAGTKAHWGSSLAKFEQNRASFLATAGMHYSLELDPTDTLPLNDWATGQSWGPSIDVAHAHLIVVHWAAFSSSAGLEIWIVNPTKTGWQMYLAY
jgi:hypothetical protein